MDKEKTFPIITKERIALLIAGLVFFAFMTYLRLSNMISSNSIFFGILLGGATLGILVSVLIQRREEKQKQTNKPREHNNTATPQN
jgi:mannose/fructose/N-acetylgalactosamine-specific phosphotransferase system component IIC